MTILQIVQLLVSVCTLIGFFVAAYLHFRKPQEKLDQDISNKTKDLQDEINLINQRCDLKHKSVDDNIVGIKENHLKHIEKDINTMKSDIVEIKTILKERSVFK